MAAINIPQNSRLVLKVQTGVSSSGSAQYAQRTFNNVKADAADADIHAVAAGLAGLQQHSVAMIKRVDEGELVGE